MSRDRPTLKPEWATSTIDTPDVTKAVEPTAGIKADGDSPGNPRRTYHNWFKSIVYQWTQWLDQSYRRTDDLHADQALPLGTAPTIAAGLGPVAAGDFSGAVYVDGFRVGDQDNGGVVDSPGHTYAATSDTYWDLGRDCTWTPVVVAAMAAEPALTPNSVRVYRVRTDATDRTSLEDRRSTEITIDSAVSTPERSGISDTYQLVQVSPRTSDAALRMYISDGTGFDFAGNRAHQKCRME